MSLVVILCEDRFRDELEALAEDTGYHLLEHQPGATSAREMGEGLLPSFPDLAVVVSEISGQGWFQEFDQTARRYWLVKIGAPRGEDFHEPTREPHRRLLSVNPSSAAYLRQLLDDWRDRETVRVDCFTFGYRNGLPAEADWVVDTRFLDSPYWIPEMRQLSGSDPMVRRHMMAQEGAQQLVENFLPMLLHLLPLYRAQRRSVLRIAVGCTGGQHRSVAIAAELVDRINRAGVAVARHLEHPPLSVPQSLD